LGAQARCPDVEKPSLAVERTEPLLQRAGEWVLDRPTRFFR
jgi:hypothetical protein